MGVEAKTDERGYLSTNRREMQRNNTVTTLDISPTLHWSYDHRGKVECCVELTVCASAGIDAEVATFESGGFEVGLYEYGRQVRRKWPCAEDDEIIAPKFTKLIIIPSGGKAYYSIDLFKIFGDLQSGKYSLRVGDVMNDSWVKQTITVT